MWLFEGEALSCGGEAITTDGGVLAGTIQIATRKADGAEHDAFVTDADLPTGEILHGVWIIVRHGNGYTHGYEIDRVEKTGGKTAVILTMDHGLTIDGATTQEIYFPQRTIQGVNSFRIPLAASATGSL